MWPSLKATEVAVVLFRPAQAASRITHRHLLRKRASNGKTPSTELKLSVRQPPNGIKVGCEHKNLAIHLALFQLRTMNSSKADNKSSYRPTNILLRLLGPRQSQPISVIGVSATPHHVRHK
jgi:hypothetical protein